MCHPHTASTLGVEGTDILESQLLKELATTAEQSFIGGEGGGLKGGTYIMDPKCPPPPLGFEMRSKLKVKHNSTS